MASVTEKPQPTPPPTPAERAGEPLVDQHIRRTRRAIKLVDLTAGLITLTIGVLAFLLVMAVLEHWVIPGGWSDTARFSLFGFLILGVAVYCWRTFLPLLRQSINPVYAAQAIEQGSPSLKNSLLNLLLLRNRKQQMSRQVLQAVEQQAAQRLAQVPVDSVVDRSAIVRLGYLLLAITAICVLYRILSPKDLFSSAGRVLMPWSEIATPSRVQILNVTPGDAKAARGEQLQIAAEVHGLEEDEPVRLLYSTADEQVVGQEIRMKPSAGGTQFSCRVPARSNQGGIQQGFSYWIEAGDARSPQYQVSVFARPTLVVNRLRYDYPAYTGYPSREVEHTGDISAVEGTRVTLFAQANKPIKTAHVDFEADGRRDLLMNANVQEATVTFPLGLRDDRRTPRYASYVLRYETTEGNQNQHPPKYEIDVQPDYSPEIQLLLPEEAMLEVAVNQEVNFEIEARDPDFALSKVVLLGKLGEEQVLQEELLQKKQLARNHTGKFIGKLRKTPQQMGLKAGDVLEYWAAAADNRRPKANLAYSAHRKLRVVGPWQGNENGEKNDEKNNNGQGQQQPNENGESDEQGEGKNNQEGQPGAGDPGNSGEGESNEQGEGAAGQKNGDQNGDQNKSPNQEKPPGESASADGRSNNDSQGNPQGDSPSKNQEDSKPQNENSDPSNNDPSDGEGSDQQSKVSPEGDDDSSAFERMAEHFKEQADEKDDDTTKPKDNPKDNADGKASDGKPDTNQSDKAGESENDAAREGEQSDNKEGAAQERVSEDEGAQGNPAPGEDASEGEKEGEGEQQPGEQSPDEKMSPEQGEAGAGEESGNEQGTPDPEGAKQAQSEDASEDASKANDQAESDSKGSEGGDRSGGGEKGAGQQADADGKGGAGENQAADDGAGKASEKGEGETGQKPGDQTKAEGKTGESSGDQKGQGSKQAQKPGETTSEGQNQKPAPGESASADGQPQPAGAPSSGTGGDSPPPPPGETQPGDDANLDYARKQTDLILDRLDDQLKKQEVDKSLLEKLGWTQDELRRFVDRWKNLKSQTDDKSSPDANQQLNDALRSLGLQPNRRTGYQSKITQDKLRDLRDAYRGRVPLEYQEQVNRYIKGTATGQENQ